ncbi:MAG: type 1 glutamine amidotransferase [Bacteroidota bacterium]|jgi:protease I|nr:type 1 glutamine amidotransferase [Bacteroidota bacterium]
MENKNKRVAVLVANGFEQSEFEKPVEALKNENMTVEVISLKKEKVKGWKNKNWGDEFEVDHAVTDINANDYDALVLPGGVMSPDALRSDKNVINFVRHFFENDKPIAAICHGPWTLIETEKLKGRKLTSYKSIQTDLKNAGAIWTDEEVVVDQGLVTSRSPEDLPAFCKKMIEEIKEGKH